MIRILRIQGFKSLPSEEIALGRVNCFIGANGVGKSNVLEALGVLGAAASGVVDDESLLRRGVRAGVPRLYKSSFASERTPVHIGMTAIGMCGEEYRISLLNPLESPEPAWSFKTELLSDGTNEVISDGVRNKRNLNPKAGLAALKIVDLDPENKAAILMKRLQEYAIYCPNTPALRGVTPDVQTRAPVGLSGGQLAEGFAALRSQLERAGPAEVDCMDDLVEMIDWIEDVQASTQAGSLLSTKVPRTKWMLKFTDRFMNSTRNELTAYDASEGALYVIFCAVLCLSDQAPRMFAVDNIDQALNPRLLTKLISKISGWLLHSGTDRQILFTAHNPAVLDGLDLADPEIRLFAVERNNKGFTNVRPIVLTDDLASMSREYPLSRLWMMGHLGAVPNV